MNRFLLAILFGLGPALSQGAPGDPTPPVSPQGCARYVTPTTSQSTLSREETARFRKIVDDPASTPEDRETARWSLGEFSPDERDLLARLMGTHERVPTLDEVFAANASGIGAFACGTPNSRELIVSASGAVSRPRPPYQQLYDNLTRQFQGSKLFTGFKLNLYGHDIQLLKIKPVSEWPGDAGGAIQKIPAAVDGLWMYAFGTHVIDQVGDVPTMNLVSHYDFVLKPNLGQKAPPPSRRSIDDTLQGSGDLRRLTSKLALQGFQLVSLPWDAERSFKIPVAAIDWESSFFELGLTQQIPSQSIMLRHHGITILTTHLGREAILIGGSSGRLQNLTIQSGATSFLPEAWARVPQSLRTLPQNLEELNAYLNFLSQTDFRRPKPALPN